MRVAVRSGRVTWRRRGRRVPGGVLLALWAATALLFAGCGSGDASGTEASGTAPESETEDTQDGATEATVGGSAEVIEWDYNLVLGPQHPFTERAVKFADQVREATDGQLDITVRSGGELPYAPNEFLARTGDNSVQMSQAPATFISGDCPVVGLTALPMLVPTVDEWLLAEEAMSPYVDECLASFGAENLYSNYFPSQQWWGRGDPVEAIEGLQGLQIRQTGAEYSQMIEQLRAEPITLTTPDVAPSLQRGVVDAVITAAITVDGSQWGEFLDWGWLMDLGIGTDYVLINSEAYEGLPEDLRASFDEVATQFADAVVQENEDLEAASVATLRDQGLQVNQASAEERQRVLEVVEPLWGQWAADGGPEVEEALEALRSALE